MPKIKIRKEELYDDFSDIEEVEKLDENLQQFKQEINKEFTLGKLIDRIRLRERCPSCGGELVYAPVSDNQQGTGQTYSQRMKPYSIYEEIVCSRCGLVVKEETRRVYR